MTDGEQGGVVNPQPGAYDITSSAKALGIDVPMAFSAAADEIIE
jgi:hypothetical protein